MSDRSAIVEYIIAQQQSLTYTDFVRELFMIPDRLEASSQNPDKSFIIETECPIYKGRLFVYGNAFYGVSDYERIDDHDLDHKVYRIEAIETNIPYHQNDNKALCTPQDIFYLMPDDIVNYKSDESIQTTIGIFIANYLFFVYPFHDIIDYLNEEFTDNKMEKRIGFKIISGLIDVQEAKDKYINCLTLFGQSNEIICPNITEKTITVPPEIKELRDKLVKENKDALERGDASIMAMIEKQLIARFKAYLKGDPSMHFLLKKKVFDVTLKKLLLTQGMTEIFGSPGQFKFIENPMGNGWKKDDLPYIFNEVRSGSFSRAIETANGGVIAKLILRVLQDTRIDIEDCGTLHGEHVHGTKNNLEEFLYNYTVESDGSNILISEETEKSLMGRDLIIRTPGYCEATQGFCAKCFGHIFMVLGQKAFAPIANDLGRNQLVSSLKKMHGSSHSTVDIDDLDKYVV